MSASNATPNFTRRISLRCRQGLRCLIVRAVGIEAPARGEASSCRDPGHVLSSAASLIGNTPMVYYPTNGRHFGTIACKLEFMNGSKSVKDRIAHAMIEDAEQSQLISPGRTTLIEPTSGNTGIALAYVAAARGYRLILTMPESMSEERKLLLKGYGAELYCTPRAKGMRGSIQEAQELCERTPGGFCLAQFDNPANPAVHYRTTGPEIWKDTAGQVGYLVVGVGTGGTLTGAGRYLKEQNPKIRVIAVEPRESPVIRGGKAGSHGIAVVLVMGVSTAEILQGIGAGFVPKTLDTSVVDDVVLVSTEEAEAHAREAARHHGLLVGTSSGAALAAARRVAKRTESRDKLVVTVLASCGERYLSTRMYSDLWTASSRPAQLYGDL